MAGEWKVFPALQENYEDMLAFLMAQATAGGVPENRCLYLQLGFEEAVVNVISYAYAPGENGQIWLRAAREENRFVLEIFDNGAQFNPLEKKTSPVDAAKETLEDRRIGGLGIVFIRKVFDEVRYQTAGPEGLTGNRLTMAMNL